MATEFYKSIPKEIISKLEEYCEKYYTIGCHNLYECVNLSKAFYWKETPEDHEFWEKHYKNKTFPIWSDELNRFIDPPQVNTITVNADEYQAMRDYVVYDLKMLVGKYDNFTSLESICKSMGIDINEITK